MEEKEYQDQILGLQELGMGILSCHKKCGDVVAFVQEYFRGS